MKNIEDDPTITPGSVTPSPLLAPMTKPSSSSMSSELPSLSLAPSTWAYNPQQHGAAGDASKNGKNAWSDGSSGGLPGDLWSSIGTTKSGSGPPGLAASAASKQVTSVFFNCPSSFSLKH